MGLVLILGANNFYQALASWLNVGDRGREGLGGLEGLKPPFESDGELFPLTFLFSPDPASSGSSDPFVFTLGKKGVKEREGRKQCSTGKQHVY